MDSEVENKFPDIDKILKNKTMNLTERNSENFLSFLNS
jgi:hypothetical protein